ncbi:MAG TPA: FecR domain-containing protein [Puia sp.]|nr:FecR domain-containing protein [Puia sp.]
MDHNNRLWLLISRRLSGEASPAEERELQELLRESPDKHQLLDILHTYFSAPVSGPDMDLADRDLEQRFRRIVRQEPRKAQKIRVISSRLLYYAAACAGAALLAWGVFGAWGAFFGHQPAAPVIPAARGGEVVARPGVRTRMLLPDGTQVWLNSNSKLKYAADFNLRSREVELEGEAYFDVVRDMARPFIVHASAIDVRVLGTAFTVKSYPQDETIEATLLKGAIEVSGRDNPNSPRVILKPDEKLVLDKHLLTVPVSSPVKAPGLAGRRPVLPDISVNPVPANIPDSEKVETSWLYNRLVFNGDPFNELAEKMERWYNVKIVFQDEGLYKYRFAGAFANESVQDALNALQLTAPFTYKISGNVIEIEKK